ncbi:PqqD family protein [Streptomyces sp. NPDC052101]|uniref:PqqD family protein n=1 Tax=Streptomyces sp. NPDC052101 TaxID=3155763 RepID=UPI003434AC1F
MGDTELQPGSVVRRRMEARTRKYRGKLYIAVQDQALELDEIAQAVFRRIDGTSTLREVAAGLAQEYGVPADEATTDTVDFAGQLLAHGVVEVVA